MSRTSRTPESHRAYMKDWHRRNPQAVIRNNLRRYGLTVDDYDRMLEEQGGVCAVCENECRVRLSVDHDHETGEVRGLLCGSCNLGLGKFKDSPELLRKAAEYLGR